VPIIPLIQRCIILIRREKMKVAKLVILALVSCFIATGMCLAADQVTITWWHLDVQDAQKAAWQKMADDFMALHPNVKIEVTVLENESFKSKVATMMQSGTPPDLIRSWGGGVMNEYAKAGLLKDITKEVVGSTWGKSIGKGAMAVYSFKGKYYGAPYDMGAVGLWYNKAIFKKVGVKPFKTWSDLIAGVKKIKAAGIIPIAVGEGDKWPGHFWWVYLAVRCGGKEAFDAAYSRKGSFADPPFIKAGEKLKELVDLQPFQNGFLSSGYNDESLYMATKQAAMELMGQWGPENVKANSPDKKGLGEDLGWMPFPVVEGGKGKPGDILGGGNGYILGKNAPQEAIDFLKYITSVSNEIIEQEVNNTIPTVAGAQKVLKDPNMRTIARAVANAEYFQLYYDQYLPPSVAPAVLDGVQGIFAGSLTPKECAQKIDDAMAAAVK
jgi:raffinose/stachyose/melibiose transport system substrate-binding protein